MSIAERIDFVLVQPVESGNVGSVARALKNTGFSSLHVVDPQYTDTNEAYKFAVHAADLLKTARVHDSIEAAVEEAAWVVGLSCRPRSKPDRKPPISPEELLDRISSMGPAARTALVFGPEPTGLTNSQLGLCHDIMTLPTDPAYPSMNLSHSVMVSAWEIAKADRDSPCSATERGRVTAGELEGLVDHARRTLEIIGYLDPQNPDLIMDDLRKVFARAALDPRELHMLRGIFHRMDVWIAHHGGPPTPNQPRGGRR